MPPLLGGGFPRLTSVYRTVCLYWMKRMDYLSGDTTKAAQMVESAKDWLLRLIIDREIHVIVRPAPAN